MVSVATNDGVHTTQATSLQTGQMRTTPVLPIKLTIWRWFKCKRIFREFNLLFALSSGKYDKTFLLSSSVNWPFRKRKRQRLTSKHRHLLLWIPFFASNANVPCDYTLKGRSCIFNCENLSRLWRHHIHDTKGSLTRGESFAFSFSFVYCERAHLFPCNSVLII